MRYPLLLALSLLSLLTCSAQGLNWNKEAFEERTPIEPTRDALPSQASLKRYAPFTHQQYGSTCVAFSLATARTILLAQQNNITDQAQISALSFSPWFIYYANRNPSDVTCADGLDPDKAISFLLNTGSQLLREVEYPDYYPFTKKLLTNSYPPLFSSDVSAASRFKLTNAYKLETLDDIKIALALNLPVLIGMIPPDSFEDQIGNLVYQHPASETPNPNNAHAMVVVGYNDNFRGGAIEVLNSWGKAWGREGYIHILYSDVMSYTVGAYALEADSDTFSSTNPPSEHSLKHINEQSTTASQYLSLPVSDTSFVNTNNYSRLTLHPKQ